MSIANSSKGSDTLGRDIVWHEGQQLCNNFNWARGCQKPYCKYLHVCKLCKAKSHGKFNCDKSQDSTKHGQPSQRPAPVKKQWLPVATSPVNYTQLSLELKNHPDRDFSSFLCNSIQYGFDMLVSESDIITYECKNALSARKDPETVQALINDNLKKGL